MITLRGTGLVLCLIHMSIVRGYFISCSSKNPLESGGHWDGQDDMLLQP